MKNKYSNGRARPHLIGKIESRLQYNFRSFFLLFPLMLIGTWVYGQGNTCIAPKVVTTLPYTDAGNTSAYGDDYSSGDKPANAPGVIGNGSTSGSYLNGDDVVYAYTPAANEVITVSATGVGTYTGLFAFTGCPFASTVGYHSVSSAGTRTIPELPVAAGITYYFVISTWPSPQSTAYTINITKVVACSGMPTAGSVPATLMSCPGNSLTLAATGSSFGETGVTVQWESSPASAGTWIPVAGATAPSSNITAPPIATDYRLAVTCSNSGLTSYSNTIVYTVKPTNQCYCVPIGSTNNSDEIINFTLSNLNNNSAPSEGVSGYSDYTTTVSPALLEAGASYAASLTSGAGSGDHGAAIWIDYNQNGVFDASEMVAFLPNTIAENTTATFPLFTVPGATPAGTYGLRIQYHYDEDGDFLDPCFATSSYSETEDYAVTVFIPSCSSPSNLTASPVGTTTATISWDAPLVAPASGYEYYLSQTNTAPTAITVATGTTGAGILTENLTSLSPSTEYFVWVRSVCSPGNKSIWTPSTTFRTTQIPATLPLNEDFTSMGGWDLINGSQTNQWYIGNATGNTGNSLYVTNDAGVSNAYTNTSTSVVQAFRDVAMTGSNDFDFQFDWKATGEGCCDYLRVWLVPVTYVPVAGTQITSAPDRVQIGGNFNLSGLDTWKSESFILPSSLSGQSARLVFEWRNDGSAGSQPPAAVDNIKIIEILCSVPTNITVTPSTTTAQVSWIAPTVAPANGYEYYFSTNNTAPGSGTVASGSTAAGITTANIGPLTSSTMYYVWVRSICTSPNNSLWAGPTSFFTLCDVETAPWTYDVEAQTGTSSNSLVDGCWTATPNSTSSFAWNVTGTGTTTSSNTGPSSAHSGSKYFFTEASNSGVAAELLTPVVNVTSLTTPALEFYYHMYGSDMGNLFIEVSDGATWTVVDSLKGQQQTSGSDPWLKKLVILSGYTGEIQVRLRAVRGTSFNGDMSIDDISIVEAPLVCSGTPSPGIITGPASACANVDFTLSVTPVAELGITYQWQSSPSGLGTWSNILGAILPEYTVTGGISAATDYQLVVTCLTGPSSATSAIHPVTMKAGNQCYCIPTGAGNNSDEIRNFTLSNLNHSTPASEGVNGYSNYSESVAPADLETGTPYVASLTSGSGGGSHGAAIWVDLNQNGVFEATEKVAFIASNITASQTVFFPQFSIPAGTPGNTYRLRVQYHYSKSGEVLDPCTITSTFSETEDYAILLSDPLAITLGNLSAENQGKVNVLNWKTLKEADGDRFEIERSIDGRNFEVIAHLEAKGEPSAYRYVDEKPYTGVNYYRLGFLNIDAAKEYSKIVQASVKGSAFAIKAYPNPTSDLVKIQVLGSIVGEAVITISDVTGKVVKTIDMTQSEIDLSMSDLASGLYIIKYQDDVQNAVLKVTKD